MAPVVGGTVVAPLTDSVWRADALACGSVAIIPHVTALTGCAAALLEVEESSSAPVTFGCSDARLTPTLTGFITVE